MPALGFMECGQVTPLYRWAVARSIKSPTFVFIVISYHDAWYGSHTMLSCVIFLQEVDPCEAAEDLQQLG